MKLHLTTAIVDGEFKKDLPPCESSFDIEELSEIVDQCRIQSEETIPNLLKALKRVVDEFDGVFENESTLSILKQAKEVIEAHEQ